MSYRIVGCTDCEHWIPSGEPSGTGFCGLCDNQKDETSLCSCLGESGKPRWKKKEK